ncbi:hypothetical protein O9G_006062, partial [Rozella allomycis CSF55]
MAPDRAAWLAAGMIGLLLLLLCYSLPVHRPLPFDSVKGAVIVISLWRTCALVIASPSDERDITIISIEKSMDNIFGAIFNAVETAVQSVSSAAEKVINSAKKVIELVSNLHTLKFKHVNFGFVWNENNKIVDFDVEFSIKEKPIGFKFSFDFNNIFNSIYSFFKNAVQ